MKRIIKFKAWDEKKCKFIKDFIFYNGEIFENQRDFEDYIPAKHLHLLEFSGLKDANGVEIYEGDIISIDTRSGTLEQMILKVEFSKIEAAFMFVLNKNKKFFTHQFHGVDLKFRAVKIIGNIYENTELL